MLDGDLDPVIQALDADVAERLAGQGLTVATTTVRQAVKRATKVLAAAGVPSPRHDAEVLAARMLGVSRGGLVRHEDFEPYLDALVARRPRACLPATPDRPGRVPSHRGGRGARGLRPASRDGR